MNEIEITFTVKKMLSRNRSRKCLPVMIEELTSFLNSDSSIPLLISIYKYFLFVAFFVIVFDIIQLENNLIF